MSFDDKTSIIWKIAIVYLLLIIASYFIEDENLRAFITIIIILITANTVIFYYLGRMFEKVDLVKKIYGLNFRSNIFYYVKGMIHPSDQIKLTLIFFILEILFISQAMTSFLKLLITLSIVSISTVYGFFQGRISLENQMKKVVRSHKPEDTPPEVILGRLKLDKLE